MSKKPLDRSPMVERGGFALWGNQNPQRRKRLIEFRAGKMHVREKIVYPDTRKGLVYIYQDEESTMHFCWMDRTKGETEDDFLTMPTDCFFKRIKRCTTGRVYLLKMKSSNRTHFYWMQEPSSASDLEICNRVNHLLNFPPPRLLYPEQIFNNELRFILNQLNSEQLQALYNGDNITLVDTRHQSNESRYTESFTGESSKTAEPEAPAPFVNLGDVVNEESIKPITKRQSSMTALGNKLPPVEGSMKESLEATVKSIPFKQAILDFSIALKQGTLAPILREMGINNAATEAADKGDVDGFIKALQGGNAAGGSSKSKPGGPPGGGGSSSGGGPQGTKHPDPSQRRTSESQGKSAPAPKQGEDRAKDSKKRPLDEASKQGNRDTTAVPQTSNDENSNKRPRIDPETVRSRAASMGPSGKDRGAQTCTDRRKPTVFEEPSRKDGRGETTGPIFELLRKLDSSYHSAESLNYVDPEKATRDKKAEYTLKRAGQWVTNQNRSSVPHNGSLMPHENLNSEDSRSRKRTHDEAFKEENENQSSSNGVKREDSMGSRQQNHEDSNKREVVAESSKKEVVVVVSSKKEVVAPSSKKEIVAQPTKIPKRTRPAEDSVPGSMKAAETTEFHPLPNPSGGSQAKTDQDNGRNNDRNDKELSKKTSRKRPHDDVESQIESEQQTEPVTIRSITGVQAKIVKKTVRSTRPGATENRTERSQNTDPVRIEEKQKRQQKRKDQSPPDEKSQGHP